MSVLPACAQDEEFAPFRITDVHGSVSLRVDRDTSDTNAGTGVGGADSSQLDQRSALAVRLATRSFVYHPNFLSLDVDFGPILQHARFVSDAGGVRSETSDRSSLYDLSVHANFLRERPYPAEVYYEHLNPTVSLGPAAVVRQENERRGIRLALLDPITPVPMRVEWDRLRSTGSGAGRIVDEDTERYVFVADRALSGIGSTQLRIDGNRFDSQSGSVALPVTRSVNRTLTAGLDTRLRFGEEGKFGLTNLITFNSLDYVQGLSVPADRRDARFFFDFRTRHSDAIQSHAALDVSRVDQGAIRNRTRATAAGVTWWPVTDLSASMEVRDESIDTTELDTSSFGVTASLDGQWDLAGGRAQVGYTVRLSDHSQRAAVTTAAVIGERLTLSGVALVPLERTRVVGGSVQVFNEARTQAFIEGRDYLISVIGVQTRLQRIASGDIVDGQVVLVDYSFDTGGTFDSTQADQALSLLWSWRNRFSVYARCSDSPPQVTAGVPLLALNTVHARTIGARADLPLGVLWVVGGSIEREDRDETILPFKRESADAYLVWEEALLGQGGMRVGARRQRIDYESSSQDVRLTGYDFRYWVLTPWGVELQADWSTEKDVGAPQVRRRDFGSLRARWSYRQLWMTLSLTRTREEQGPVRTTRTLGRWLLQRDF